MTPRRADDIDLVIWKVLSANPLATNVAVAEKTGLSRNTIRSRLDRYERDGELKPFERRIDPAMLGYTLRAVVLTTVKQRQLDEVAATLRSVPEVIEVLGLSGVADLLVQVVARDADDLYRVAGDILGIDGVKRTVTGLVMRTMVDYRVSPILGSRRPS
jgi:DNA-binding Lrp family transcriptional regulator